MAINSFSEFQLLNHRAATAAGGYRQKGITKPSCANKPLVTVVTAVYNDRENLANCIESVIQQDYPNVEHIIFDGSSTDGTVNVLRDYNDQLALWKSEPDSGIYDAWNKALQEAQGEWVTFLGADDEFLPGAISAYIELAVKNPEAEFLSSRIKVVHSSGYEKLLGSKWSWPRFSREMCTPHVGSMHRRSLFDRFGYFDTSYKIVADYEFLLRPRQDLRAAFMPQVTAIMRAGGVGSSRDSLKETVRAKISTAKVDPWKAYLDLTKQQILYPIRPSVRYFLRKFTVRRRTHD